MESKDKNTDEPKADNNEGRAIKFAPKAGEDQEQIRIRLVGKGGSYVDLHPWAWERFRQEIKKDLGHDLGPSLSGISPGELQQWADKWQGWLSALGYRRLTQTFKLPSNIVMWFFFGTFAGGIPPRIPSALLDKPYNELTDPERQRLDQFAGELKQEKFSPGYTEDGPQPEKIRLTIKRPKVETELRAQLVLFQEESAPAINEYSLAAHTVKAFGAEGLRHFYGLCIGLDDAFNVKKGEFLFDIHEHLGRLGYSRGSSYYSEAKKKAFAIVWILTHVEFYSAKKKSSDRILEYQTPLFYMGPRMQERSLSRGNIFDAQAIIRAEDAWYKNAFEPPNKQAPQFTQLLKSLAKEDHTERPITLFLAGHLAVTWRSNWRKRRAYVISVRNLMLWCNLDTRGPRRTDDLKRLETELDYMAQQGYLGAWENLGYQDQNGNPYQKEDRLPSGCKGPFAFECQLKLTPPAWMQESFKKIRGKKESTLLELGAFETRKLTRDDLNRIKENSGLTNQEIADALDITRQMVGQILRGDRPISKKTQDKIRAKLGKFLLP